MRNFPWIKHLRWNELSYNQYLFKLFLKFTFFTFLKIMGIINKWIQQCLFYDDDDDIIKIFSLKYICYIPVNKINFLSLKCLKNTVRLIHWGLFFFSCLSMMYIYLFFAAFFLAVYEKKSIKIDNISNPLCSGTVLKECKCGAMELKHFFTPLIKIFYNQF